MNLYNSNINGTRLTLLSQQQSQNNANQVDANLGYGMGNAAKNLYNYMTGNNNTEKSHNKKDLEKRGLEDDNLDLDGNIIFPDHNDPQYTTESPFSFKNPLGPDSREENEVLNHIAKNLHVGLSHNMNEYNVCKALYPFLQNSIPNGNLDSNLIRNKRKVVGLSDDPDPLYHNHNDPLYVDPRDCKRSPYWTSAKSLFDSKVKDRGFDNALSFVSHAPSGSSKAFKVLIPKVLDQDGKPAWYMAVKQESSLIKGQYELVYLRPGFSVPFIDMFGYMSSPKAGYADTSAHKIEGKTRIERSKNLNSYARKLQREQNKRVNKDREDRKSNAAGRGGGRGR